MLSGTEFIQAVGDATGPGRENLAVAHFMTGSRPSWLNPEKFVPILLTSADHKLLIRVAPDVFSVGNDADFVRWPLWPATAQRVASSLDCILPSRKLSADIYAAAPVKLNPSPIPPSPLSERNAAFVSHSQTIDKQLASVKYTPGDLVAGHKKDVVVGPNLNGERVAIYGWQQRPDGKPIQPYSTIHDSQYSDYSHGIRLIDNNARLDGEPVKLTDLFISPYHQLVSDQGPFYPAFPNTTGVPTVTSTPFRKALDLEPAVAQASSMMPAAVAIGLVVATLAISGKQTRR